MTYLRAKVRQPQVAEGNGETLIFVHSSPGGSQPRDQRKLPMTGSGNFVVIVVVVYRCRFGRILSALKSTVSTVGFASGLRVKEGSEGQ